MFDNRGQAHTLEGVVAALLLLSSLLFALQITAVTPLSASTSSQHIQNQQRAIGSGILVAGAETDVLEPAVLFWNSTGSRFHGSRQGGIDAYSSRGPPNQFGQLLDASLAEHGIAYNIRVVYNNPDGTTNSRQMVNQGVPSDNAVSVSRAVMLTDGDVIYDDNGNPTGQRIDESNFYAEDVSPDTPLYNVVTVEVTIWRI